MTINYPYNQISIELFSELTDLYYSNTGLSSEEITSAISRGQIYSKQWMVQELAPILPNNAHVFIFGSWIGLAARLLFEHFNDKIASITCVELDPRMDKPSYQLNGKYGSKFNFINENVFDLILEKILKNINYSDRVFINCSCDNIDSTERYVEEICPLASVNVLQQNNYKNSKSHLSVNCLNDFENQIKNLKNIILLDTYKFNMYERYMAISKNE